MESDTYITRSRFKNWSTPQLRRYVTKRCPTSHLVTREHRSGRYRISTGTDGKQKFLTGWCPYERTAWFMAANRVEVLEQRGSL